MVCAARTMTKKRSNFVLKQQIQYVHEFVENTNAIKIPYFWIEYMVTKYIKHIQMARYIYEAHSKVLTIKFILEFDYCLSYHLLLN
jgi:hypothetical protein